jgi:hypothetical protein
MKSSDWNQEDFELSPMTIHRLWIACLFLSSKFLEDPKYQPVKVSNTGAGSETRGGSMSLKMCAKIGGVSERELRVLEREALVLLDFNLFVGSQEYWYWAEQFRKQDG